MQLKQRIRIVDIFFLNTQFQYSNFDSGITLQIIGRNPSEMS